jgi:peroxiredoxin
MGRRGLLLSIALGCAAAVKVGDTVTGVLDFGFPPEKIDLASRLANKRVLLIGLPGAFTPT